MKKTSIGKNTHKAIISKADFDTVQSLIKDRRKDIDGAARKLYKNVYLFTHMIKCKDCGRGFHYKRNRKGYICGGYDKHGLAVCSDHLVHETFLIYTIRSDLQKLTDTIGDAEKFAAIKEKAGADRSAIKRELGSIDKKIDNIYAFKKNALEMQINGKISHSDYNFIIAEKEKEIKELLERKREIDLRLSETIDDKLFEQLKKEVDKRLSFEELTRETLNRFVSRIEVGEDRTIDIHYKFHGSDTVMNLLMS